MKHRHILTAAAALCAAFCLVFGAAACGSDASGNAAGGGNETTAAETPAEASAAAETPDIADIPVPEAESPAETSAAAETPGIAETPAAGSDVLVVCFSVTGNTRGVAERMAAILGADTAEIVPAQPYTDEDIDYSSDDDPSRSRIEADDPDRRPEIGGEISLEGYSTVFLGYPIWYGQEPRILDTFVESHDFTGITVIPFCTSGSSGIGNTGTRLAELSGTGNWLEGQRFSAGVSDEELRVWLEGLRITT